MSIDDWGITRLVISSNIVASHFLNHFLIDIGKRKKAAPKRAKYVSKVFNLMVAMVAFFTLLFIWQVDSHSVLVFASSSLAVLGVALFAKWSILSNLTASVVIFFYYTTRIGDHIRIVDAENSLEGTIIDISMFQAIIQDSEGNQINYPNNLLIQKPLINLRNKPDSKMH
jgi:small-conductance mechanosensitive channel